jgi:hypothetical protein
MDGGDSVRALRARPGEPAGVAAVGPLCGFVRAPAESRGAPRRDCLACFVLCLAFGWAAAAPFDCALGIFALFLSVASFRAPCHLLS